MAFSLIVLAALVIAFPLFTIIAYNINAGDHKYMTIKYTKSWGYGTFNDFEREYKKRKWLLDTHYGFLYDPNSNSKLQYGIVEFSGKGMVLRGLDFVKYHAFITKAITINKEDKQVKDLWNTKSKPNWTPEIIKNEENK